MMGQEHAAQVLIDLPGKTSGVLHPSPVRPAAYLAGSGYLATGLGILTAIVATRLLSPSEYGAAALAVAYPTLLGSFVAIKTVTVTTRYLVAFRSKEQWKQIAAISKFGYGLDLLIALAALALLSGTSHWVAATMYKMPQLAWVMIAYGASWPLASLAGTSCAILSSHQKFTWLAGFQAASACAVSAFTVWFLVIGFGVPGMVLGPAVGNALAGFGMAGAASYVLYHEGAGLWWKSRLRDIAPIRKEMTSLLGWNFVSVSLGGLVEQVPLMLLGAFRGAAEAGFYRLALSITGAAANLQFSLGRVVYPLLSGQMDFGEVETLKRSTARWTRNVGLPIGALLIGVTPLIPVSIPLIFGPNYASMALGTQFMWVGMAMSAVFFWLNSSYYAAGRFDIWVKSYTLYAAAIIGCALIVLRLWGFVGVAAVIGFAKVAFTLSMAAALRSLRPLGSRL